MDFSDSPQDRAFRQEVANWLAENVVGEFAALGGRGGSGDESFAFDVRREWERVLAKGRWTCLGWPVENGGRGASIAQQVIFNEEYVRAKAPGRVGVLGEGLLGPTLIHYGTKEQQERFLPPIVAGEELWSQGYSEPNAGSDLASLTTKAELDGDEWVITGQKVWTSLAHQSDWCFVLCRTDPESVRHKGLSYLLVPLRQDGIEIRPIRQLTDTSEFNEVFFDGARTHVSNVVGDVGQGWMVGLATLSFERGVGLLGHLLSFQREFEGLLELARQHGRMSDPVIRDRIMKAFVELEVLRATTARSLTGVDGPAAAPEASILKLFWSSWHQQFGSLAMDIIGIESMITEADYELTGEQRTFLFSRAETIYGGSNEIQRTIIGERVLGLPSEAKPQIKEARL